MVGKRVFNVTEAEEKLAGNNKKLAYCLFVKVHIIMLLCNTHKIINCHQVNTHNNTTNNNKQLNAKSNYAQKYENHKYLHVCIYIAVHA